ncbi:MAG: hypothetical protein Q7T80_15240 [Methanoregula sp.]|nr:hypothetical protein [Methanoregula sp.]
MTAPEQHRLSGVMIAPEERPVKKPVVCRVRAHHESTRRDYTLRQVPGIFVPGEKPEGNYGMIDGNGDGPDINPDSNPGKNPGYTQGKNPHSLRNSNPEIHPDTNTGNNPGNTADNYSADNPTIPSKVVESSRTSAMISRVTSWQKHLSGRLRRKLKTFDQQIGAFNQRRWQ